MTDFEVAYLVTEQTIAMQTVLMNTFSIVTSFLLIAYFISDKLTRMMSNMAIALFVITYGAMSLGLLRTVQIFVAILGQVKSRPLLAWHPAFQEPENTATMAIAVLLPMLVLIFAGSIFFYLHARKRNPAGAAGGEQISNTRN